MTYTTTTFIVLESDEAGVPDKVHGTFEDFEAANDCAQKLKAGGAKFTTVFELEPPWLTAAMTEETP
jgi:hypothetical protein